MNKNLKKMIVAVSAVAMCATSVISMGAGAIATFTSENVTPYTTKFSVGNTKYHLWQKATDYFENEKLKIYITDSDNATWKVMVSYRNVWKEGDQSEWYDFCNVSPFATDGYHMHSEEDLAVLENYLSDKGIQYTVQDLHSSVPFSDICVTTKSLEGTTRDEMYDMWTDIKENTGFTVDWFMLESSIQITDIKNALPEPTFTGDATEDGEVNIADADMDGDGVTAMDTLAIQEMILNR